MGSTDTQVTGNWASVGAAVRQRRAELGFTKAGLARQANVSRQLVIEIETEVERKRSPRTLSTLSTTLGWHEDHLLALLFDHLPPHVDDPRPVFPEDIPGHMSVMENQMRQILAEMRIVHARLDDIWSTVDEVNQRTRLTTSVHLGPGAVSGHGRSDRDGGAGGQHDGEADHGRYPSAASRDASSSSLDRRCA